MKYRFKILYRTEYMIRAAELMEKFDLGDCSKIGLEQEIVFTGKDHEVSFVKSQLKKCFEDTGCEILHIEGGKVE